MPTLAHFATLWETFADSTPDAPAVSQGERRRTWAEYDQRAARLSAALEDAGLGRDSKVALALLNSIEYLEAQFAAFKHRGVPVNVNYRYRGHELLYLLDNCDAEAVLFHSSLAAEIESVRHRLPRVRLWIQVDDVPHEPAPGVLRYEELVRAHLPAPRQERAEDDSYMLYTGGTTGMPKGVVFPVGEFTRRWVNAMAEMLQQPWPEDLGWCAAVARELSPSGQLPRVIPACPLMHGTGMWLGVLMPHSIGGEVVLLEGGAFDADLLWHTVQERRVNGVVVVGDAFALPLVRALDAAAGAGVPYDISSLQLVMSSGAMLSAPVKADLMAHLPDNGVIGDLMGSTEGPGGTAVMDKSGGGTTARFTPSPDTRVLNEDDEDVVPGSGEQGLLAVSGQGNVPIGYYKDPERTARLIRLVDGKRYSLPGDWATVEADGTIVLLGRGSGCINTAGEKVFPEEVEEVIKTHPCVDDCLVIGIPDPRFGQRVAAVVSGSGVTIDEVFHWAREHLATYKAPREIRIVRQVPRGANGKADVQAARALLEDVIA